MSFKLEKRKWGKEIEYSKNHVICRIANSKANQDKMHVCETAVSEKLVPNPKRLPR